MSATFPGMFWIYRDDLLRQHEIDFGFVQENQAMSTERGGRARLAFPDPAGGRRPNWRADRSSTSRSISAADRRITARPDPIARTTKVNPLGIYSSSKAAGGPCARRSPRICWRAISTCG